MTEAPNEAKGQCELCGEGVEPTEIVIVGQTSCCRTCSPSIRSDLSLVDEFVSWHRIADLADFEITKAPNREEFQAGRFGAVVEFEYLDLLGTIIFRADGQCDSDLFRVSTSEQIRCQYDILVTPDEVREYLWSAYQTIRGEQDVPPKSDRAGG